MRRIDIIDLDKKLTEEWLAKGNKPKVFTRDFNNSDYRIGYVNRVPKSSASTGGDKWC